MLSVNTLLSLIVSAASIASAADTFTCDRGVVPNSICFSDCNGNGIYVETEKPLVAAISIPSFQLEFDPNNPNNPVASSSDVFAKLAIPESLSSLKLTFQNAGSNIDVAEVNGDTVATLSTADSSPAKGDSVSQNLYLTLDKVPMKMKAGADAAFRKLFKDVTLGSGTVPLVMSGYANTKALGASPDAVKNLVRRASPEAQMFVARALERRDGSGKQLPICLNYVPFKVTSGLGGFGGLSDAKISALPVVKGGSVQTGINLEIPLDLTSPSNVVLNTNTDVAFDLTYNDVVVGNVRLPKVSIKPGVNKLVAISNVFPDKNNAAALKATRMMLSNFTGGNDGQVVVKNGKGGIESLADAFGAVVLKQTLPSNKKNLINVSRFAIPFNIFSWPLHTKANIFAYNPFDAPVSITYLKASLIYENKVIGTIDQPIVGFNLQPKENKNSPSFRLDLKINGEAIKAIFKAIFRGLTVTVDSVMTVSFNGYDTPLDYVQKGVVANLVFSLP
ncbi:hypothetical protein HDU97_000758 [Phlyctochytrium planicorne]|nr:hypothetical protein HDU97_000758 [Phlyctochytrium planicorne]